MIRTEYALQIVLTTSGLSVVAWGVQQGQAARLAGAGAGAETLCFWLGCTEESKPSLHQPILRDGRQQLPSITGGSCVLPPANNRQQLQTTLSVTSSVSEANTSLSDAVAQPDTI